MLPSFPIATVRCYFNGQPTTIVTCYNVGAILYAVEAANPADAVKVQYWGGKR